MRIDGDDPLVDVRLDPDETYADLPLGTVDASVIAPAERLNLRRLPHWIIAISASSDHGTFPPSNYSRNATSSVSRERWGGWGSNPRPDGL